ncbi:ROK family transcriptional regulator [Limosilactobacillus sp.]|jgi:predicted NBD/HSP70 family sugar kinase|uniref:ROK family transcriptional regulator n=1 Tax=Limosilactobacillus sp. TaxID=2773925 RepID=UPI0025BA01F3|nr:ROK family transcriptional regulator [Limosilactobacillus sp.]MCH3922242.1 ROK family transcriptional regulator [Limosilactobacillus sp.]MCH3929014.1 ROK family transcriptional regulator [Limosilactobacillus sp.]
MAIDHRNMTRIKNRKLVLQQLFNNDEISRAEIARRLNLNKSTVSSIYSDLKEEGYIEEIRQGESSSNGGRKPSMIKLNRNYGFVASFNVGTTYLASMFNYTNGEIIQYDRQEIAEFDILNIMQMIKQKINELQKVNQTRHGLLAICFSVHGIVFNNEVRDSPFLHLNGVDLRKYFEQEFDVPVVLENEANLTAVFEQDYCTGSEINNLIAISVHRGIGMGIITAGSLYRGNLGTAGEIGRDLTRLPDGSQVKVESLCSEDVIFNQVMAAKGLKKLSHDELRELYINDDEARKIVDTAIQRIADVAYNAIVTLGPQEVFFSSSIFEELPGVFDNLQQELVKMGAFSPIRMVQGSRYASLLGASSMAIHHGLGLQGYWLRLKKPQETENIG